MCSPPGASSRGLKVRRKICGSSTRMKFQFAPENKPDYACSKGTSALDWVAVCRLPTPVTNVSEVSALRTPGFVAGTATQTFLAPPFCQCDLQPPCSETHYPPFSRPSLAAVLLRLGKPNHRVTVMGNQTLRLSKTYPRCEQSHSCCEGPKGRCLAKTGRTFPKETPTAPSNCDALSLPAQACVIKEKN